MLRSLHARNRAYRPLAGSKGEEHTHSHWLIAALSSIRRLVVPTILISTCEGVFDKGFPKSWEAFEVFSRTAKAVARRRSYVYWLMQNQWTLKDASDPDKLWAAWGGTVFG